ncbi:MAG: hypothetical protein KAS04_01955 [Candidatus Aenigmarchaeota archaeon]|nr:hypothetical protein [Candidatus Aenigmarchaeota archaeon]
MKGDIEYLNITFALLIFMGTVVLMVLMTIAGALDFGGGVKTDMTKITAIEASHMVESCLIGIQGKDSYSIPMKILDDYNGKKINDDNFCGIKYPEINAEIEEVETGKKWTFGDSVDKPSHQIWITIEQEDPTTKIKKVSMGKLSVKIKI